MGKAGTKRPASRLDDSDSEAGAPVAKKTKNVSSTKPDKDSAGNVFWEFSKNRRITISEFRKTTLVSIREYYEKDGTALPGKKGISLSLEQYQEILRLIPAINAELEKQTGQSLHGSDAAPGPATDTKVLKKSKAKKSNFEATSDEDED